MFAKQCVSELKDQKQFFKDLYCWKGNLGNLGSHLVHCVNNHLNYLKCRIGLKIQSNVSKNPSFKNEEILNMINFRSS